MDPSQIPPNYADITPDEAHALTLARVRQRREAAVAANKGQISPAHYQALRARHELEPDPETDALVAEAGRAASSPPAEATLHPYRSRPQPIEGVVVGYERLTDPWYVRAVRAAGTWVLHRIGWLADRGIEALEKVARWTLYLVVAPAIVLIAFSSFQAASRQATVGDAARVAGRTFTQAIGGIAAGIWEGLTGAKPEKLERDKPKPEDSGR